MNRRDLVKAGLGAATACAAPKRGLSTLLEPAAAPPHAGWQTYEVTTTVEVLRPAGRTRVWVPQALEGAAPFQRVLGTQVTCDTGEAKTERDGAEGVEMLRAEFHAGTQPEVTLTQRVATRDWRVDLRMAEPNAEAPRGEVGRFLQPTQYVPTDGIVKQKADEITRGAQSDVAKAHAVYTWVVENTHRDAKVRGCGRGDVRAMLASGELGGKCADLNALFVGLLRASGVPARDVYGLRIGPSQDGYKSLGTKSEDSTKAQHCRAEVYLQAHGWVPMDPADVRKVILEEPPGTLTLADAPVRAAREQLFGSWEMNWMAFNYAQDVMLPGSEGPALPFFMYPVVETDEGRLDSLDPEGVRYTIRSRKVTEAKAEV